MMTTKTLVLSFVCAATMSANVYAADRFAAIAASTSLPHIGSVNDAASLQDAMDEALRDCGYQDCVIAASVKNGCVAYAFGYASEAGHQWYGFADGTDRSATEQSALQICEVNEQGYCNIGASICTNGDQAEAPANLADLLLLTPENSPEARGILKLVNIASARYLRETVGLPADVSERLGAEQYVATLTQLITDAEIGVNAYSRLLGFARQNGYIHN